MDFRAKISMYLLTMIVTVFANAQDKKASPAETAKGSINGAEIAINYGSPSVRGREIWGKLVPFGEVWRAGANEATTFETSKMIAIAGQKLAPGKYSLFIIPEKDKATVIFNSEYKQWGAYDYDKSKDVLRVEVKPQAKPESTEKMLFTVNKDNVTLSWEKRNIVIPIK